MTMPFLLASFSADRVQTSAADASMASPVWIFGRLLIAKLHRFLCFRHCFVFAFGLLFVSVKPDQQVDAS